MRDRFGCNTNTQNFINGSVSHIITWFLFIPIDTIKTNIQRKNYTTIKDIISTIYKKNGLSGFWRGIIPACLRTIPVSGISMIGYEYIRQSFTNYKSNDLTKE
jgi:hypothetical protein